MSADKLCIDLCSGLGGFSRAFKDAGWEVVTVDVDPRFEPTICGDILTDEVQCEIQARAECAKKVVILASPPCERFSLACRTWPKAGIQKGLNIVGACLEIIAAVRPDYWVMENPKGRLRWFLGTPACTIRLSDYGAPYLKPTDIWGNMKFSWLPHEKPPTVYLRPMKHDKKKPSPIYYSGHDKASRAEMPYGLSLAALEATNSTIGGTAAAEEGRA